MNFKNEISILKGTLSNLENDIANQTKELETRAEEWNKRDETVDNQIKEKKDAIITLDIGGKVFRTKYETLLSVKDTLFCKIILDKQIDLNKEIFIDRDSSVFAYVLSYLRNKKKLILQEKLSKRERRLLYNDAKFYEIKDLALELVYLLDDIYFVNIETSGLDSSNKNKFDNIDHFNDYDNKSCEKGIFRDSAGLIVFELNKAIEWDEAEVGGYAIKKYENSKDAQEPIIVDSSLDNVNWVCVGNIENDLTCTPKTIRVSKVLSKYIRLTHTQEFGIGYFKIKK